jgi:hypothetical protein
MSTKGGRTVAKRKEAKSRVPAQIVITDPEVIEMMDQSMAKRHIKTRTQYVTSVAVEDHIRLFGE